MIEADGYPSLQDAIDAAALQGGGAVRLSRKNYTTGPLHIPGQLQSEISLLGDGAVITANAQCANGPLLEVAADTWRQGWMRIEGITFDAANQPGCVPVLIGQRLHVSLKHVFVKRGVVGIALLSVQECHFENVVASSNMVGWFMKNPSGGLTITKFTRCAAQDNTHVGAIIDGSKSSAPAQSLDFDGFLSQNNRLCGLYAKRVASMVIRGGHFEVNGRDALGPVSLPSWLETSTYNIAKSTIDADDKTTMTLQNVEIPESQSPVILTARNGSLITAGDSGGIGNRDAKLVTTDSSSRFAALGFVRSYASGGYYERWPDGSTNMLQSIMYGSPVAIGGSLAMSEVPQPFAFITNGQPQQTLSDAEYGRTLQIAFSAAVGSPNGNQIVLPVWQGNAIRAGEYFFASILARTTEGETTIAIRSPESVNITQTVPLNEEWRRIVVLGKNVNFYGAARLFIWPAGADGPSVQFALPHSCKSASVERIGSIWPALAKGVREGRGIAGPAPSG